MSKIETPTVPAAVAEGREPQIDPSAAAARDRALAQARRDDVAARPANTTAPRVRKPKPKSPKPALPRPTTLVAPSAPLTTPTPDTTSKDV